MEEPLVLAAFEKLQQLVPLNPKAYRSTFENKCQIVSNWLLGCACTLFLILLVLVAFVKWVNPELQQNALLRSAALTIGILTQIFAILALAVNVLPACGEVCFFGRNLSRKQVLDFGHDLQNAAVLLYLPLPQLKLMRQWLLIEIDRVNERLALFFGSPNKITVLALIPMLAGALYLLGLHELWSTLVSTALVMAATSLVFGLRLGGLIGKGFYLPRLNYHRDLIDLAITQITQRQEKNLAFRKKIVSSQSQVRKAFALQAMKRIVGSDGG